ncbi:MAG: DUF4864 domain-containing protein [Pseudomonadota bacterium]
MKRRVIVMLSLLMGLLAPLATCGASAEEVAAPDAQEIHALVQEQLEAFANDDAEKAFDLTTDSAREQLGSADDFLLMIKTEYPAIYRHRRALFSVAESVAGNTFQIVRLTDGENNVWLAIYQVERESNGRWKIDGCILVATSSVSI